MLTATDVRVGDFVLVDGKISRVLFQEIKGTGKFGKTVHLKLKCEEDGHATEKSLRAEDKIEDVRVRQVKMQYLYREADACVFMNLETYEQFSIPTARIGERTVFLKENAEITVLVSEDKVLNVDFPKTVELKVTSTTPGSRGLSDTTFKEAELENGLKILIPQFVQEGETVRLNVDGLAYVDRVTLKSMRRDTPHP